MKTMRSTLILLAVLAIAAPLLDGTGYGYLISVLTRISIYALAASALGLVLGHGGLVSFGHAAYLGIGAYVTGILAQHAFDEVPLFGLIASNQALIAWPLAALLAGFGALLIGAISLRTRGVYFIMITLAFAQMIYFLAISLQPYGGEDGLSLWWGRNTLGLIDLDDRLSFFYVTLVILALWQACLAVLVTSPLGRTLQAAKQNPLRLVSLGIDPYRYQLAAFALSGAIVGLAGALLANANEFVSPAMLHWSRSGELMIMCILGGLGTLIGPLLGAIILISMEELLIPYTEHWQLLLGVTLLAIVMAKAQGLGDLIGSRRGARDA